MGASWEPLADSWRALGSILGASWGLFAAKTGSMSVLGSTWGPLGSHVGGIFGAVEGDFSIIFSSYLEASSVQKTIGTAEPHGPMKT